MAHCTYCGISEPLANPNLEHFFIPPIGCVVKPLPVPGPLPPCSFPYDPFTGRFTHDINCLRHN